MRFASLLCCFFALSGFVSAQDTNFSTGPQYLMNYGSPLLLRPITTPTLSLSAPLVPPANTVTATPGTSAEQAVGGFQKQAAVNRIYWGVPEVTANPSEIANESDTGKSSEIELNSAQPARALPSSIFNAGVTGMTDAQSLRETGYGVPLGDVAASWKATKPHATRVFTNADIARFHGG